MKSTYNTFRPSLTGHLRTLSRLALPILCLSAGSTHAVTYFGSLSNFDVVNNSTEPCNGFEIELDGLTSKEITYTFIYQSYGTPRLVDSLDANGKPVVKIRYESKYNPVTHTFLNTTPVAPIPTMTTAGHQCTSMPNAQNTSGCEHYGLGIIGNPTKTIYRWLVADPVTPGNLTYQLDPATGLPDTVSIPAPVFVVNAQPAQIPQPPAPVAGALPVAPVAVPPQPVVQVEIEVPEAPEPINYQYGKAMWVKVFTTESPSPRDLKDLVTDNAKVPNDPSEIEVEWQLLQKTIDPKKLAGGRDKLEANLAGQPMAQGNESVTRRYEFYEYAGEFDPENNEVLPVSDSNPVPGDIGNYIGAQMAAMNVFDADSDTKDDVMDNCLVKPNTDQRDTDSDGFGNVCDPDLNNDFVVNNADLNLMKLQFLKKIPNPDSDLNGDGKVNFNDLAILKTFMGKAPGPQAAK
ncbi:dockerin type I domain-containing protein [Methylobacter psychrophilus]|uniref:dockerin type I domain-containing protein n=1 Tax=Methylobacter psychrophilus TaxID=96941 RepID=UPI0021D50041|nr:dockerin type I domain-containing protein [Methylobacter psychrophilus]